MKKLRKFRATPKIVKSIGFEVENYKFIMDCILAEEKRGLNVTVTRIVNSLIAEIRLGFAPQNETAFRKRRRSIFEYAVYKNLYPKKEESSNEQNNQS